MREFRALHGEFEALGATVAGCSIDPLEKLRAWAERMALPYPLLSDAERRTNDAFRLIRRVGLGAWSVELFRRATLLADRSGVIRAVWSDVKVRGHARQVLDAVRALQSIEPGAEGPRTA